MDRWRQELAQGWVDFRVMIYEAFCTDRFLRDVKFRTYVLLHLSVVVDLVFSGINLYSGLSLQSEWFIGLSIYYFALTVIRFCIVKQMHGTPGGGPIREELLHYRRCGTMLFLLTPLLAFIIREMTYEGYGSAYPGRLVIAVGAYTFYCFVLSLINIIRYRKYKLPVLSSAKVLCLTVAMVSLLSLEASFFDCVFPDLIELRNRFLLTTGPLILAVIFVMSGFMVLSGTARLHGLDREEKAANPEKPRR